MDGLVASNAVEGVLGGDHDLMFGDSRFEAVGAEGGVSGVDPPTRPIAVAIRFPKGKVTEVAQDHQFDDSVWAVVVADVPGGNRDRCRLSEVGWRGVV